MERNEPHRAWTGAFSSDASTAAPEKGRSPNGVPNGSQSVGDSAYEAVNNAYRVIDEYLRQGQSVAQRLWMPGSQARPATPNGSRPWEGLLRMTGDVAQAWLEVFQRWAESIVPAGDAASAAPPGPFSAGVPGVGATHDPSTTQVVARHGVSLVIDSGRPLTVSIDLHPGSRPKDLSIGPLRSRDPTAPAIDDVRIEHAEHSERVIVHVRVPSTLSPGVYNGLVLERDTDQPKGTLSIVVP